MSWHKEAEKRKRAADAADIDWAAYFESIKRVCPWSSAAFKQNKIRIQGWHGQILDLGTDQAIVYTAPYHKPRQLKRITDRLNSQYAEFEFLWSHPRYAHNSTPIPVIIQQSRDQLEMIRKTVKSYD